jgi:DNA-binding transcriptional LysR family regulator
MRLVHNPSVELRELEWFTTLAEVENMTVAAARLNVSQPTLSRALARLERKLGVKLLDRHRNRLQLNKYGEIFRTHALRAIKELERAEERIATLVDPEQGTVSVGFLHDFGGWLVPDLLRRYREVAASVTFELRSGTADVVVDDVRQGRVDIGLVAPAPVADDLEWIPLGREQVCVAVPVGHPLATRDRVALAELQDEPMVALRVGAGLRQVNDRLFREAGIAPHIAVETTELATLRALVEAGLGVAIIPAPQRLNRAPRAIANVPLGDGEASVSFGAITRPGGPGGHTARRFCRFVAGERDMSSLHREVDNAVDVQPAQ